MKSIRVILVSVLLLQIGYLPCAAQEVVTLQRSEIDPSELRIGTYVEVTYTRRDEIKTVKGYIKTIEDDALRIIGKGGQKGGTIR